MAYATTNPPQLIGKAIAQKGQVWEYRSTDGATTVDTSGYITNALYLGMRVGDIVYVHDTDASPYTITMHTVMVMNANGSADLSTAGVTFATNSD